MILKLILIIVIVLHVVIIIAGITAVAVVQCITVKKRGKHVRVCAQQAVTWTAVTAGMKTIGGRRQDPRCDDDTEGISTSTNDGQRPPCRSVSFNVIVYFSHTAAAADAVVCVRPTQTVISTIAVFCFYT